MATIIYPPTIDWSWMTQRPQHLMNQFAQHGHEVFYCNINQSDSAILSKVDDNLYIVHNNKAFIRNIIPMLKLHNKIIVVWVTCAKQFIFTGQYFPDYTVYDYVDDFPAWDPYVPSMVKKADLILTTARRLDDNIRSIGLERPHYSVPNGCNLDHFSKSIDSETIDRPPEFSDHEGPIVTYVGAWAQWVNQDWIWNLARKLPHVLIAIIGPEFGAKMNIKLPNIRYLGLKSYDALPQYLHHSNVGMIPFKRNSITRATNPVKMYEYLAAGLPVVSSNLPEVQGIPYAYTCDT